MAWYSLGGGGGVSSDEVTAMTSDVLEGKTAVTKDSNDDVGTGTLSKANVRVIAGGTLEDYDESVS